MDSKTNEKICCICSSDARLSICDVLDKLYERISLKIELISKSESVSQYDYIIVVLSDYSSKDVNFQEQLREAYNLNKTFIPVILEKRLLKRMLLKRSYSGPNLRTAILMLCREKDMLQFYSQVIAYAGKTVVGDPYGIVYIFNSSLDCRIVRRGIVIAELVGGKQKNVTLLNGMHHLSVEGNNGESYFMMDFLSKQEDSEKNVKIELCLTQYVDVVSTLDCELFLDESLSVILKKNKKQQITLVFGKHRLKFVYKTRNRYVDIKLIPETSQSIFFKYPFSPKVTSWKTKRCNIDRRYNE